MSNKKLGNDFESEFCEILAQHGFWVHNMQQNASGQPADVIASRNRVPRLVDCKVCSNNQFSLSRVEENQIMAMERWYKTGNGQGWFALKLTDGSVWMLTLGDMKLASKLYGYLTENRIRENGVPLKEWIEPLHDAYICSK